VIDAGGAPETVTHGEDGFRVPPGDTEAFAAHVTEILRNEPLRRTLSVNALSNAREFTPDRMVERALAVYERARRQTTLPQADLSPPEWGQEQLAALEDSARTDRL
jgi:glycosyltransferase involved in cell wall biosynthesis